MLSVPLHVPSDWQVRVTKSRFEPPTSSREHREQLYVMVSPHLERPWLKLRTPFI
jgi:hypothetical protein